VYLHEVRHGGERVDRIDRDLEKLALPSLGQWLGIVRFGSDGNLRLHTEHGYAKATFAYDTHGHKIQEAVVVKYMGDTFLGTYRPIL
jgi:hypothetical protein